MFIYYVMYIHNIYTIFTYVYTKRIIYILYIVRIYTYVICPANHEANVSP